MKIALKITALIVALFCWVRQARPAGAVLHGASQLAVKPLRIVAPPPHQYKMVTVTPGGRLAVFTSTDLRTWQFKQDMTGPTQVAATNAVEFFEGKPLARVTWSFSPSPGIVGYRIYNWVYGQGENCPHIDVGMTNAVTMVCLMPGTNCFRVCGLNSDGVEFFSERTNMVADATLTINPAP